MHIIKIILFIFCFAITLPSSAQGLYPNLVFCDTANGHTDLLFNPDGSYYTVGLDSIYSNDNSKDGTLNKFSANHVKLWTKTYGGSKRDVFRRIRPYKNGQLIITGETNSYDGDVSYGYPNSSENVWVLIVDSMGNILHGNVWGSGSSSLLSDVAISSSGLIFLTGYTIANLDDFAGNTGPAFTDQAFIIKTDSLLNKLALRLFVNQEESYAVAAEMLKNDTLMVNFETMATSNDFNFGTPLGLLDGMYFYLDTNLYISRKIRKGGTLHDSNVWTSYDSNTHKFIGVVFSESLDGDFYANQIPSTNTSVGYYTLYQMNAGGEIEWKTLFGMFGANLSFPSSVNLRYSLVNNDKIWMGGTVRGRDDGWIGQGGGTMDTSAGVNNNDIFLLQYSKTGVLERKLRFGECGTDALYYIRNNDNGKIFIGVTTNKSSLCPVNPFTCAVNQTVASFKLYEIDVAPLGLKVKERQNYEAKVYPNPANNVLFIEFEKRKYEVFIYNQEGKKVHQFKVSDKKTSLNLNGLSPGMYQLNIHYHNQIYPTKFIINP